jgi:hypothetical protein
MIEAALRLVIHLWLASADAGVAVTPLAAQLARDVGAGQAVAILPTSDGLLAISADGSRRRQLAPGPIKWALVDDRAQAIWFGRAGELWMIDLLGGAATPERLARYRGDEPITVVYGQDRSEQLRLMVSEYDSHLNLELTARPSLEFEAGIYDDEMEEQGRQVRRRLSSVTWDKGARERVKSLATRARGRSLFLPDPPEPPHVTAVPRAGCEQADLCGSAKRLGKTRFFSVITRHSCGDACHLVCELYDSESHLFVDPAKPSRRRKNAFLRDEATSLQDAFIPSSGEGVVVNGALYHFNGGLVAGAKDAALGGGWLGAAWHLPDC